MNNNNNIIKSQYKVLAILIALVLVLAIVLPFVVSQFDARGHGFIGGNSTEDRNNPDILHSRAQLGRMGFNFNVGAVQWEPQSVEWGSYSAGPGNNPALGSPGNWPQTGRIASGGMDSFSALDEQSTTRWARQHVVRGTEHTIVWTLTAPHVSFRVQYWITNNDWNPNAPLAQSSFTKIHEQALSGMQPSRRTDIITLPANLSEGYHILLGIWAIDDTTAAFFNVVDLQVHAADSTLPTPDSLGRRITPGDGIPTGWVPPTGGGGTTGGGGAIVAPPAQGSVPVVSRPGPHIISWTAVEGALSYDVSHNGIMTNTTVREYTVAENFRVHGVRALTVRAVTASGPGAWAAVVGMHYDHQNNPVVPEGGWYTHTEENSNGSGDITKEGDNNFEALPDLSVRVSITGDFVNWTLVGAHEDHFANVSYEIAIEAPGVRAIWNVGSSLSFQFVMLELDANRDAFLHVRAIITENTHSASMRNAITPSNTGPSTFATPWVNVRLAGQVSSGSNTWIVVLAVLTGVGLVTVVAVLFIVRKNKLAKSNHGRSFSK